MSFQAKKGETDELCELAGSSTFLFNTRSGVSRLIHSRQTMPALTGKQERFYRYEAETESPGRLLVQPENKRAASAIAYSLMHVHKLDPDAPALLIAPA